MALHVTQCPRCESTFNTSARMLEAAHGLVRCGACLSIFEADQHFIDPLPAASNDEHGELSSESVFISGPEEYFDPDEFLNHGKQAENDALKDDEDELLYAKSDVHDSSFNVFDVDPVLEESKVHEQILDSDFDVFEVGDTNQAQEQAKAELQDNEFDIFDAGERVRKAKPDTREESEATKLNSTGRQQEATGEPFQLNASFSFSPGMPQAIFVPVPEAEPSTKEELETEKGAVSEDNQGIISEGQSLLDSQPAAAVDNVEVAQPELPDDTERTLPPQLADESVVILPEGPDAATLLKTLHTTDESEVILPSGPDAATLLAELKISNEQSIIDDDWEESEQSEVETVYEEPAFLPGGEDLDEAGTSDSLEQEFDNEVNDFSDAVAADLEWEEADLEVDGSSFVILPADPYQPSAFLELKEEPSEQPADDTHEVLTEQSELDPELDTANDPDVPTLTDFVATAEEPVAAAAAEEPAFAAAAEEPAFTATAEEPAFTATAEEPAFTATVEEPVFVAAAEEPAVESYDQVAAEENIKDVIRSHVMATELEKQDDSLEQLSEENLRAVRDVDTALELEQKKRSGPSRTGSIVAGGLLLVFVSSLVFFWLRMPELSQDPRFRSWYQSACNLVGCSLPDYVNASQVETSNLVVRSHPQQDNTLELTAVFRNAAQFPQPFPLIELTFSDLSNRPMMVFEFLPDEYLPQALRGMPLMPVGAPVQITLDLADPGSDAVNYQMAFKAAPPRPR